MASHVHVIIVSHNSEKVLPVCIEHLRHQTVSLTSIIIVDSGSRDTGYLEKLAGTPGIPHVDIFYEENIGFSKGNNIGYASGTFNEDDLVFFINPDTFLPKTFTAQILGIFSNRNEVGAIGSKLCGYDIENNQETGLLDSTGIFRNWFGRWYDRGQGERDTGQYEREECVSALCGALLCCRVKALLPFGVRVFDEDFFLYKEDIELGLRMRKAGWKLLYCPQITAYHCRGWQNNRRAVSYTLKMMSAANEILLYKKHPSAYIIWAMLKYYLVKYFRV